MHKRSLLKVALALVAVLVGTASPAWCDSFTLTLVSSGGGVYDYAVVTTGVLGFATGDFISFSGLSGVTGASILPGSPLSFTGFVASFSPDTVSFQETGATVFGGAGTFGDFIINSSAPVGTVAWKSEFVGGGIFGFVAGPVATTPEPGSLSMLLAASAGFGLLAFFVRRRGVLRPLLRRSEL